MQRAVQVLYAAIDDDDFVRGSGVARIAYRFTGQTRQEVIPKLLNRLRSLLANAQREYDKSLEDLQAYRANPNDNEAAAKFGRFVCFVKGDWETGLPLMAKGGFEELRELANRDLNGAETTTDQIALGDAWWELADRAKTGVYRQGARDRSVFWYEQAFKALPESLDKLHVKSRLDEAKRADATSPIALTMKLADELGVDLGYGLAGIADVGQDRRVRRESGRIGDDED